jgi:hypothetical protein
MHSEDPPENNTKTILLVELTKKKRTSKGDNPHPPPKHEKAKRVVTTTKLWNFSDYELCHEYQKEVLVKMNHENIPLVISSAPIPPLLPSPTSTPIPPQHDPHSHIIKFIYGEIQKKIYGYKCQDLKKELFSSSEFVNMENIIKKLMNCKLMCYYCKEPIYILYEYVREPRQWTLERINNAEGHTTSNTEIACLKCNLSRRCMFHERYLFTKQISNIIKK